MSTDRIEKSVFLRAPRSRVWQALADADAFGEWFGVKLDGQMKPGARLHGKVTHPGYEEFPFEITIERMETDRLLSWHWHPDAPDPKHDYSGEPPTLVVFELEDAPGGTRLTVVESGFDAIPPERRAQAYRGNDKGWAMQMEAIERYVTRTT
jgi:uncharacterized protein YndB with AHSA1/START domain